MPTPEQPTTAPPPQRRPYLTREQKKFLIRFLEFIIVTFTYYLLLYYLKPVLGIFIVKFLDELHGQFDSITLSDILYPDNPFDRREQPLGVTFTVSEIQAAATSSDMPELPPDGKALAMRGERDCPICLETFIEGDICRRLGVCKHVFHSGCVDRWLETKCTCPVCRMRVESAAVRRLKKILNHIRNSVLMMLFIKLWNR